MVVAGTHTTAIVCVAKAPASSGGSNCGYDSAISALSVISVLQSAGSFGIVKACAIVHGVAGASVEPALITVVSGSVQLISSGVPPGNGLCSVMLVTVAAANPRFWKVKVHVTVSPIVYGLPGGAGGQSFSANAPVGSWAWAGAAASTAKTPATTGTRKKARMRRSFTVDVLPRVAVEFTDYLTPPSLVNPLQPGLKHPNPTARGRGRRLGLHIP